jgi:hypothetical protein
LLKYELIYRKAGRDYGEYGAYVNPLKAESERVAPHWKQNWHNLLVSNLDSWKEYPKRNKSIIASGYKRASRHGGEDLYLVIPFDNIKFGWCSEQDFWYSFKNLKQTSIPYWTDMIIGDMIDAHVKETEHLKSNWKDLKYILTELEVPKKIKDNWFYYFEDKTLLEHIDLKLNPEKNGFKLLDAKDVFGNLPDSNEVWTEGECILIKKKYINEILQMLQE